MTEYPMAVGPVVDLPAALTPTVFAVQIFLQNPSVAYSLGGEGDVEPDAEYGEQGRVLNWEN